MYHNWLDRWDERCAARGDDAKKRTAFILDAPRAFANAESSATLEEFCQLAEEAVSDPRYFARPDDDAQGFERQGEWLKFPSDIVTDVDENNLVWARVTDSGSSNKAMVIFHHWNATSRNDQIAKFFSKRGVTVVEVAMPYHFERSRPGSLYADYILSANLGRTLQAVRQAVLDGRKIVRWLKEGGYQEISVFGMSLGSWVAGLVAAHDPAVTRASLFLTAGSLADMVWTGRATRSIRESLAPHIGLSQLRRAWAPLNVGNFTQGLSRRELSLQIIVAKRDTVVLPELSQSFMHQLANAGCRLDTRELNCGHYSLAMPPYILVAGMNLKNFLSR